MDMDRERLPTAMEFIDFLEKTACQVMRELGEHHPQLLILKGRELKTILAEFPNAAAKQAFADYLHEEARQGATMIGMVTEGWSAVQNAESDAWVREHGTLSTYPKRQEVLMIEVRAKSGERLVRHFQMHREGGRLALARIGSQVIQNRFLDGLWDDA